MICEYCRQHVESVNEADECETCEDECFAEEHAFWGPVYEGEKRAGLHGEFTEEGLSMRRREMAGAWFDGLNWSATIRAIREQDETTEEQTHANWRGYVERKAAE